MAFLKHHNDQVETLHGGATTKPEQSSQPPPPVQQQRITFIACFLGMVASIGGFMFGYVRYVSTKLTRNHQPYLKI